MKPLGEVPTPAPMLNKKGTADVVWNAWLLKVKQILQGEGQVAGQVLTSNGDSEAPSFQNSASMIRCHAYGSTQSIPNGVYTRLACDSENVNVGGSHSTSVNNSRFTAPVDGDYRMTAGTVFAQNATGQRIVKIIKGGVTDIRGSAGTEGNPSGTWVAGVVTPTVIVRMLAGEYLEAWAYQDSGGALNASFTDTAFATSVCFELIGSV